MGRIENRMGSCRRALNLVWAAAGLVLAVSAAERAAPAPSKGDSLAKSMVQAGAINALQPHYSALTKSNLIQRLPRPMFVDMAPELGVDFLHAPDPVMKAARAKLEIPMDFAGGGVAAADYNGDGYPDLFFGSFGGGRLYRNEGGRRFVDATGEAGLKLGGESRAAYFIDYDNDGDLDLFVTFAGLGIRSFENDGAGHFKEVTTEVGLGSNRDLTHEAVFFDLDNDGWLDIYTASFGRWDQGKEPVRTKQNYNAEPNRLYHHRCKDGKHRFEEIGASAGVDDRGWTHCVGAWDLDQDGKPDLFSFNDFGGAHAYHNLGNGKFADWTKEIGMPDVYNGMSFTLTDLDRDGRLEMYVSQISMPVFMDGTQIRFRMSPNKIVLTDRTLSFLTQTINNRLYSEAAGGKLENRIHALFEPAEMGWAWDASALDYDNDGDLDFLVLNGTEEVAPVLEEETRRMHLAQRAYLQHYGNDSNHFFVNQDGFLYDVSPLCELGYRGNSRSSAMVDFDLDGDLDVAIADYEGKVKIFRNLQTTGNAWVGIRLVGTRSNRNALGARVSIEDSADRSQTAMVASTHGFLSQDPLDLHFGLGKAQRVVRVSIRWPSGARQEVKDLEVRRLHTITEPR